MKTMHVPLHCSLFFFFFLLLLPLSATPLVQPPPLPNPNLPSSTNPSFPLSCQELAYTYSSLPLSCQELFSIDPSFEFDTSAIENYRDHSHYFRRNSPEIQLIDAISELRQMGFSILALAIDLRLPEFVGLSNFTVFAPNDDAVFSGAEGFVRDFQYHVVPGKRLALSEMMDVAVGTEMATMDGGRSLVVTGNGTLFSINSVRLKKPDVFYNGFVSVHEISMPFPPDSSSGTMEKDDSVVIG